MFSLFLGGLLCFIFFFIFLITLHEFQIILVTCCLSDINFPVAQEEQEGKDTLYLQVFRAHSCLFLQNNEKHDLYFLRSDSYGDFKHDDSCSN